MIVLFARCYGEGDGLLQLEGLPELHVVRVVPLGSRGVDELPPDVVPLHFYVVPHSAFWVGHCFSVLPGNPHCHVCFNSIFSADQQEGTIADWVHVEVMLKIDWDKVEGYKIALDGLLGVERTK